MKVQRITIKNFKSIEAMDMALEGKSVLITGCNGQGKTSFIDSVFKILSGNNLPSKLTKDGAESGEVKIELDSNIIVKAKFNSEQEKLNLSVETLDGAKYSSPRSFLDEKIGVIDFDINKFLDLDPKKKTLAIQKLMGIDLTELDAEYQKVYSERTIQNRKVDELKVKATNTPFNPEFEAKIDLSALQAEIKQKTEINSKIEQVKIRRDDRLNSIMDKKSQIQHNQARILDLLAEIKGIENQNETLNLDIETLEDTDNKAAIWLKENTEIDISILENSFKEAIAHNTKFDENEKGKSIAQELEKALLDQTGLNEKLKAIEEKKKSIFTQTQLPVPGLSFDENGLYLNGLPFEKNQINTAELIKSGIMLQLSMMKDLKIVRFDGSLLDNKNLKEMEDWAKTKGLQLFIELVERNGEGLRVELIE